MTTSSPKNDSNETGYDPTAKWRNYFNILTGRMTLAGQNAFREDSYIANEARDCERCEKYRDFSFNYSPMVIFMQKNIAALNGNLDASNVKCVRCPAVKDEEGNIISRQGGGFNPDQGIVICANEVRDKKHLEDTLSHEMVHAWDHLRWKVDWADLRHAACSEACYSFDNSLSSTNANLELDTSVQFEWRMQVDEGVLHTEQLDHYTTASELCTQTSYSKFNAETKLQR